MLRTVSPVALHPGYYCIPVCCFVVSGCTTLASEPCEDGCRIALSDPTDPEETTEGDSDGADPGGDEGPDHDGDDAPEPDGDDVADDDVPGDPGEGLDPTSAEGYDWRLLNGGRLVVSSREDTIGSTDISHPSVVEVPTWAPNKPDQSARYYLYFAEHHGHHISMKWSANIEGPWHAYDAPGSGGNGRALRGVLDFEADSYRNPGSDSSGWKEDWSKGGGHIAGPDVMIDEVNRIFVLAFHGKVDIDNVTLDDGDTTNFRHTNFVAFSEDGLNFNDPKTGGGQAGVWGQPGHRRPYGPLEHTAEYDNETIEITKKVAEGYLRFVEIGGKLYGFSSRGTLSRPKDENDPWGTVDGDARFGWLWEEHDTASRLWRNDPLTMALEDSGERFRSHIATWFASTQFRDHPNNPYPGYTVTTESGGPKVNHIEVTKLTPTLLEVYVYVRGDDDRHYPIDDPFRDLMRVVLDVSDPDWNNWHVAENPRTALPFFDVISTPEGIYGAVRDAIGGGDIDGVTHADPVSLGVPGVIETDGRKVCFLGFKSEDVNPDFIYSEGQIVSLELF